MIWYLIFCSIGGGRNATVCTWSPPLKDKQQCEFVMRETRAIREYYSGTGDVRAKCIGLSVDKPK